MTRSIYQTLFISLIFLISPFSSSAQMMTGSIEEEASGTTVFNSLSELLAYTSNHSITLQNNKLRLDQARKAKLAAALATIDVTGALLSAQFTNNTTLGVSLFPSEIFGGEPGTFQEVQMGVQYNTNLTNYADIKLVNPVGWKNLKLSKINIDLTQKENLLSLKNLQENIAANYYNILNVTAQIASSKQNLAVADTLYQISQHKYEEGLISQQDVNESKINYLNTRETINQLEYLLEQYYISLKILCDIPDEEAIEIQQPTSFPLPVENPTVAMNRVNLNSYLVREEYARVAKQSANAAFLPTISLQLSNSNNLYNTEFKPLSGNWINSNYIGLNLSIPIPSSQAISQKYSAQFDYKMAQNNTREARIEAELDQQSLANDYQKAVSQAKTDKEVLELRKDSFYKNQHLFQEGVIGLDIVLNSFNAMVQAQYALISSEVNVQLNLSKININNKIR